MNYYRISKYLCRKDLSPHSSCDWTAFSDVGKVINGHEVTLDEYLNAENAYLSCIFQIMDRCNVKTLCITYLESPQEKKHWREGMHLSGAKLCAFIKDCLRENCWGILEHVSFRLDFGFDYYVHIGCSLPLSEVRGIAEKNSMTAEEWEKIQSGLKLQILRASLQIRGIINNWREKRESNNTNK